MINPWPLLVLQVKLVACISPLPPHVCLFESLLLNKVGLLFISFPAPLPFAHLVVTPSAFISQGNALKHQQYIVWFKSHRFQVSVFSFSFVFTHTMVKEENEQ